MKEKLLENIEELVPLTEAEKTKLASPWTYRKIRMRQFLLRQGEVSKSEYFILKGCFKTCYTDESGKDHIIRFSTENHLMGDLCSFLSGQPSIFFIEAMEDGEILQLEKPAWEKLIIEIPVLAKYYRIKLEKAIASQQTRLLYNLSMTAVEKYLSFINQYPALEQRIPQSQVAAYLGITPQYLSQVRKTLTGKKVKINTTH